MVTFYAICLLAGLIFAVVSFIFTGGYEASVDTGADLGAGAGADLGGHGVGEVHFPLFSPVVIACFVTAFGGGGLVGLEVLSFLPILSLVIALGSGLGVGLITAYIVWKIYQASATNQVVRARELIGTVAEVTEAIPASGVGEISFQSRGSRISGPARSEDSRDIKRHAMVTITRVVGGLYYVREHADEKLRDIKTEQ
jgi:membrane protein implicated in regulation of membrane protease activity